MYTTEMAKAFRSIRAPKGFSVTLIDDEHFITVRADEKSFARLDDYGKRQAVEYLVRVKKALEENGAIVLITRDGVEK
jgi:hypothetical protein